jgi:ABC-2 type transport system ATP-binding protein
LVIETQSLTKTFRDKCALAAVNLQVAPGIGFGLIGPNGAGKTTLIKILLGLTHRSSGIVRVLEQEPGSVSALRRIGYLPEQYQIPDHFTPLSYLASLGRLRRLPRHLVQQRGSELLNQLGLPGSVWKKAVGKYSKGMRQRLGLAGVLLAEPELLVLDEPMDGLDPIGRADVRGVLEGEIRRGTTVFLNSHVLSDTEKLCSEVALLHEGQIIYSGPIAGISKPCGFTARVKNAPGLNEHALAVGFLVLSVSDLDLQLSFNCETPEVFTRALSQLLAVGAILLEAQPIQDDLEKFFRTQVENLPRGL